jgi:hypothetical protein
LGVLLGRDGHGEVIWGSDVLYLYDDGMTVYPEDSYRVAARHLLRSSSEMTRDLHQCIVTLRALVF